MTTNENERVNENERNNEKYRNKLTPEEYRITREKGTERAFTGKYWQCDGKQGMYHCKCCNKPLFDADTKYDSGSGWPSFYAPAEEENITEENDSTLGMRRTEILCSHCQAHLGHVFPDGPQPTGLRYCVNSASLEFREQSREEPREELREGSREKSGE